MIKVQNQMLERINQMQAATTSEQPHRNSKTSKECLKLAHLLGKLMPLAGDWQNIGTLLSMPPQVLKMIRLDNPNRTRDCLREMREEWLKMIAPPPSWQQLVEAVEVVDQSKAKDIHDKYCTSSGMRLYM